MSDKKISNRKLIIITYIIVVFISIVIIFVVIKQLRNVKANVSQYDSYANVIEDYSFVLGCQNTVKCQVTKSGDYSRKYVYNTYSDGDDKIIFQFGLFQDSYKYEKHELFKGINRVKPFPEAALPNYAATHMEFRHYQSKCEPDIVFDPDNPHDRLALSFGSSMSYKEVMEYNTSLNNLGYAVKFCWVDTYLSDDVTVSSKYAAGRPVSQKYIGHESYSDYETAYGFLLYDHHYLNKSEFDAPAQRFIDIISNQYGDNFMSEELNNIREKLIQKDALSVDNLEIIGVILEKKDGTQFSEDEIHNITNNDELVVFAYS
jgi:hypothetical protein